MTVPLEPLKYRTIVAGFWWYARHGRRALVMAEERWQSVLRVNLDLDADRRALVKVADAAAVLLDEVNAGSAGSASEAWYDLDHALNSARGDGWEGRLLKHDGLNEAWRLAMRRTYLGKRP